MSQQITEAYVQQFNTNVYMLAQQRGSRLRGAVRNETQKGKSQFFDRVGVVTASKRTSRHASTPQVDTPHSRRRVTLVDYEHADLIDKQDEIRILIDPTSAYSEAFMYAFGRAMDDEIIEAAFGTAYSGEDGSTTVSHPDGKKYAANDGTNFTNMNVKALRAVKRILDAAEVDPSIPRYIAYGATQMEALLGQTEVTSSDFNTIKALVQGEINSYMGFKFIHSERLDTTTVTASASTGAVGSGVSTTGRSCIAWAQDGLLFSVGEDYMSRVDERSDKGYARQVYSRMSVGATRMEEAKVIEIVCKES